LLNQALILAGGFGTRLGELTKHTPKPLLSINGTIFLEYVIWNLKRYQIKNILLSVGYLSEKIISHFGSGEKFGVSIDYIIEVRPLGTGGALKLAAPKLHDQFLVLNGDTLFDFNYFDLFLELNNKEVLSAMALRKVEDSGRYGTVSLDKSHKVTEFNEKKSTSEGLVNGGVYIFHKNVINFIPEGTSSLEEDVLPALIKKNQLVGKEYGGFFIDIGVSESLRKAKISIPKWKKKPTFFLDRDGVVNVDKGYVHKTSDFQWVPGVEEIIKNFNDKGFLVIIITNQAGIARGYYSESDFTKISQWMNNQLIKKGAHIDEFYYCPHHPREGKGKFLVECSCRKPKPGMIKQAIKEWSIDLENSFFVGDKKSDLEAGRRANIKSYLFEENNIKNFIFKNHLL